ncbi:MAG: TetR-like C-terminal domain-containing protein [Lachnospiraceae bacterium]|nr:TetR-like C-terminal domain-containing protein [Lachnospiraceae bacterium]
MVIGISRHIRIIRKNLNKCKNRYYNAFYAYGLFGLLKEWAVAVYQESPAEMASFYMEHFNYQEFMYLHNSEPD